MLFTSLILFVIATSICAFSGYFRYESEKDLRAQGFIWMLIIYSVVWCIPSFVMLGFNVLTQI